MNDRVVTLDAIRGFAVMGILLLNIVDFGMPGYAYVDPHFYGGATGADLWSWAVAYVLADGKMRGLFTMMFGASTILIAEGAVASGASPARVHYARMAALFVIGMAHAYLIWSGDILVLYSLCGALAFLAWRLPSRSLLAIAALLMAYKLVVGILDHDAARRFEAHASAPMATAALKQDWQAYRNAIAPPVASVPAELAAYRGGWRQVLPARFAYTHFMQTEIMLLMVSDTLALMLFGMALFRSGFFSGTWARRRYVRTMLIGYVVTVPLYCLLALHIVRVGFDPVALILTEPLHLVLLRPLLALAHASAVILFLQSGAFRWLADRLTAVGRMAFSNYLLTSIVCTHIFCGYGLGWFGYLSRWQLYPVVLGVWVMMLLWSKPWLERFAYGPFEWLWRSLSRWQIQPLRRRAH